VCVEVGYCELRHYGVLVRRSSDGPRRLAPCASGYPHNTLRDEEGDIHVARTRTFYLPMMIAAAVAVACAVALLAVSQKKAEAAFPGKNGRIAYQGSDRVIYTVLPDGRGKTKVTDGSDPSFSADGKKIAYVATDGNDSEIYTIKATGGRPFQVTDNATNDGSPSWSPNGKRIAYTCSDGDQEICTIAAGGKGKRFQLTKNDRLDFSPSYSPSGRKIAYSGLSKTDFEVYTINSRGGGKFNVTKNDSGDYYPDYSPNGKRIAYVAQETEDADNEIRTIKATGGGPSRSPTTIGKTTTLPTHPTARR
jgi:Tol biopolymer transport system component